MILCVSLVVTWSFSSVIQDWEGLQGQIDDSKIPQFILDRGQPEALLITFIAGFLIMRAFKTMAYFLLSSKRPKAFKIIGNIFLGLGFLSAHGAILFSSSHQSVTEFSTFHYITITFFLLEFIVWELFAYVSQMVFCYCLVWSNSNSAFMKALAWSPILFYLDGKGLKKKAI